MELSKASTPAAHVNKNLRRSAYLLFYIGLVGQFLFALYILTHFGGSAIKGDWQTWTKSMIHGILEGDPIGNVALVVHIFLAFVITVGGPLQFVPRFRKKGSKFHKWNGRIYIFTALLISTAAIFMVFNRPATIGGELGRIATSINGLLIIGFAIMTWRTAVGGKFEEHRKWAIRTFIVVNGVWFFRIGFGTWFLITGFSAPGVTENLSGWFDRFLYFGSYIIPLLITEAYIRAKAGEFQPVLKYLPIFLYVLAPVLIGGTIITAKVFWFG